MRMRMVLMMLRNDGLMGEMGGINKYRSIHI